MKDAVIKVALALALSGGVLSAPVQAAEGEDGVVAFSGFGTLGAVYHNADGVQFRRDIGQAGGADSGKLSFAQDSMLGVQVNVRPNEKFEAMAQVVSRLDVNNTFTPQLTWGYLKYKGDDFSARVGRMALELYLQGDSAEIGYANLLVRQPIIFYPRTYDGVDIETTRLLGEGTLRLKGLVGVTRGKLVSAGDPYDTSGSRIWGALAEYSQGPWTGRVTAGRLTMKSELSGPQTDPLLAALSATPNGADIMGVVSMKNRPIDVRALALGYDSGPLQGVVSYSVLKSPHWQPQRLFFAHAGYRIGKVTPYAGYTAERMGRSFVPTGIPYGLSPATDQLNQAASWAQTGAMTNQTDFILGARYDFAKRMALKLQLDRIRYQDPASLQDASLLTAPAETLGYKGINVLSVTLDFAF